MLRLLKRFSDWLQQKIDVLDRHHAHLKFSDNKFEKWVWKRVFKASPRRLDSLGGFAPLGTLDFGLSGRIIHVVNLILPENLKNKDLAHRVSLALESIEKASGPNVTLLGCVSQKITRQGWKIQPLSRTAHTELGNPTDVAYLKDLLLAASCAAQTGDIIFYSNLDCPIHPDLYNNLANTESSITEFIRRDISPIDEIKDYKEIFKLPFENYPIGVDGIALQKEVLDACFSLIPDFVIGEPHWDTALSGILRKSHVVTQNLKDLYHIKHEQQWDDANLSPAGQHNKRLYRDAVEFGLMEDDLISIKPRTALVLLKHTLNSPHNAQISQNLHKLSQFSSNFTKVFCEYAEGESLFKKHINNMGYLPIMASENTKKLGQKNTILNLLRHYFGNYDQVIVVPEETVLKGELELENLKKTQKDTLLGGYVVFSPQLCEDREFDFFMENRATYPRIKQRSFINDQGLLELFNNHGYFQSPGMLC